MMRLVVDFVAMGLGVGALDRDATAVTPVTRRNTTQFSILPSYLNTLLLYFLLLMLQVLQVLQRIEVRQWV
jgi:hypothetical protein